VKQNRKLLTYFEEMEEEKKSNRNKYALVACLTFLVLFLFLLFVLGGKAHASINMDFIAQIESSNNPNKYNKRSGAIGLCQVKPSALKDYDKTYGERHDKEMLFNKQFNQQVADWYINFKIPAYLKHYGIKDTDQNRLIAYNFGIGNLKNGKKLPQETISYLVKYANLKEAK
jgi:hypothetical protein